MAMSLLTKIDNRGVATLTLNRPTKHNAFDDRLISQLTQELKLLDTRSDIRVLILTGSGESFSSGADLNWMRSMIDYDQERNYQDSLRLAELMEQLAKFSKPSIARVNGAAYGGALGLIACCDIAIAVKRANFCFSEVKLGLAPAVISPYIIAAIGSRPAKKLFLTGELFNADEAKNLGLVHHCVDDEKLDDCINSQVTHLLKGGPMAQLEIKSLLAELANQISDNASENTSGLNSRLEIKNKTAKLIAKLRTSEEGQEGLNAFLNKQKPNWIIY